ncbi:Melanoma-associated antigen E1 [Tupaia chinensis]|uniref:Melanoma-associated antigen E1 n=2 Tax=Tupaia chinensis TaxID=246437 RepID=L9KJB2_TUPCH|nr:Melanoma-associated antigen E1 [Tupaia chinensis]
MQALNAPGLPATIPGLDAPQGSSDPQILQSLCTFEGQNTSVLLTPGEGPSTSALPIASEGSNTSRQPTVSERSSTSLLLTPSGGPITSKTPAVSEGLSVLVPLTPSEGLSISVPPTPGESSSTFVPPTASDGHSTSGLITPNEGPHTTRLPNTSEGPGISGPPSTSQGLIVSVLPTPGEGQSTSWLSTASEGSHISVPPTHREVLSTSLLPTASEGSHISVPSTHRGVLSTSWMPTASEDAAVLLSSSASVGQNPTKCPIALPHPKLSKASLDSEGPTGAEGPMELQDLRDCDSSNSVTIKGLSSSQINNLKPWDPMEQNVAELLQFLLVKDQSKYSIRESEMLQYVVKEYHNQFPEILRRVAAHLDCIFRFELRELDPEQRTYILLNKLGPVPFEGLEESPNGPKMGLLMMILGQIFLNGNQAKETEIWEMLWRMGVQRERRGSIFGNPKRLLSVEFVWQRYLDYRPITDCDPVEYEFFWGPRSHVETTKMKILKFMAKVYNKDPMDWPEQYNEALEEDASRGAAEGWQALPPHRRHFFEEAAAEVATPDSEISTYSSKYPPHSWPESRLESKARKLVQLFLLMDSTKLPIPKKGILYYIGRECSKVFPDLLNRAARTLNHVYGTELVVLDPRNHSYTLYNRREMEEIEEIVDSPNRPGNNFLMQVLSFIFIMGNHAKESAVWAFLRGLGVQSGRKHVITCRYLSQRYIDSLRVPDSDPVQYEFVWGPRARLETSKMKALRYMARIHRKEPQDWPQQYREALEDEANRANVEHRQFFVHNFR